MTVEEINNILNPLAFLSLGTLLGALLNKIFSSKEKNRLYIIFNIFSILSLVFSVWVAIMHFDDLIGTASISTLFLIMILISNIALLLITHYYLKVKDIYKTSELDPIINIFTKKAEKAYINLLCGDINFFGEAPKQMDNNVQYNCLKGEGFKAINILCFPPDSNSDKIRYGKLLVDMPTVVLRYYKPSKANLSLRGRITRFHGTDKLLMYFKVSGKTYQAIESDTASYTGALYKNIWDLIWDLAESPTEEQLQEYINLSAK